MTTIETAEVTAQESPWKVQKWAFAASQRGSYGLAYGVERFRCERLTLAGVIHNNPGRLVHINRVGEVANQSAASPRATLLSGSGFAAAAGLAALAWWLSKKIEESWQEKGMSKVKHIALIKFKDGTSPEQVDQLLDELLDVTENIPGVEDYVAGENCSPEGLSHGYSHGFIMTFEDKAARDGYLSRPEHERVKGLLDPLVDSMLVLDFEI